MTKNTEAIGPGFVPGFEILNVTLVPEKAAGSVIEWQLNQCCSMGIIHMTTAIYFNYHYVETELQALETT